jgi:DNA polymerase-3 subunit beta
MQEIATITVSRTELGNAVTFAAQASPKRPVVPVLASLRVTISAGTLEVAAFDYEVAARAKVSGQASGPGAILVTGPELVAAVRALPRGRKVTAEITIADGRLVIACEGAETVLTARHDADDFPQLPALPAESGVIDGDTFARSVARVTACAGTDDTLPALLCVSMASDAGALELAATDRYRLGVDRMSWTGPDGVTALIPARELTRFAKKCDRAGKVSLYMGTGHAGFSDGVRTIIVRTSDGHFPKYRALVRDQDDTTVTVDAATLAAAVKRAGAVVERNEPVRFSVNAAGITLQVMHDGVAASTQTVPATYTGPEIATAFNPAYLASVLAGIDGQARIGFVSATKPARITAADGFTAIVMPIRLQG